MIRQPTPAQSIRLTDQQTLHDTMIVGRHHIPLTANGYRCQTADLWRLLEHDLEILEPILLEQCRLPVDRTRFREVVLANRFERLTHGRARGQEDMGAHERTGIAGDWRNYFSEQIKRQFKNRFGGVLIATGYERDFDW